MMIRRRIFLRQSVLAFAGLGTALPTLHAGGWGENTAVPPLSTFGLEGDVPNTKGKVVYLDFWASWCAPCKASFPVLNKWQQQFGSKGFTVLGINVDEQAANMTTFLKTTPAKFPVVRDAKTKLVSTADVGGMPTSFLIDRGGVIRHVHHGFRKGDEATLSAQIAALLG